MNIGGRLEMKVIPGIEIRRRVIKMEKDEPKLRLIP